MSSAREMMAINACHNYGQSDILQILLCVHTTLRS